jgi:hypothetical protein
MRKMDQNGNDAHQSELATIREVKTLMYNAIHETFWTFGITIWGMASTSNIEITERFQCKVLRIIVDVPWYVPNTVIRRDLLTPTVK